MTLLGNGFRRILLLLIIAICIILIALNIILNIKLRADIPNLIEQFSKETPYDIEVGKINLDALFRMQFDKVSITDPSLEQKDVLDVRKITVSPNILSSIFGQRIVLGEIVLHEPQVQSNSENINNLRDFIESITKDREDTQNQLVEFRTIKIVNADFQVTPDFLVSIPNLSLQLSNRNPEEGQEINFAGIIDLLQKQIVLDGRVIVSSEQTTGKLNINVERISSPSVFSNSEQLKAAAQINFVVSELITLSGDFKVDADKGIFSEKSLAEAKFNLDYDSASDTANVKSLDFSMPDLIRGSVSGQINKVTKETVFNLTGKTEPLNIGDLMVQIFGDDRGLLSGDLTTKNIKITGARASDNIRLSGDVTLAGFNFNSEEEGNPSVSSVNCNLKVKQNLGATNNFSLSSNGSCRAEKFLWARTGQVDKIKAQVNLSSKDRWSDNKITLSNINSTYMDGFATGTLNFMLSEGFGGGITTISGDIRGSNLNLEKTPRTIIPANIAGNAQSANANFQGGSSNYKADISLAVTDFVLKSNQNREFRVSKLQANQAVDFEYKSPTKEGDSNNDEILIKGGGVSYERLSFEEYNINSGTVKSFEFLLELGNNKWGLDMSSQGSGFSIAGHDVSLERFDESLSIQNSGREGFEGSVSGTRGRYKSIDFPSLSWDYKFVGDRIIVSNVSTHISTIGEFKTDELFVNVGSGIGGYPYNVNFKDATFAGFEEKLNSQGVNGEFVINRPGTTNLDWHGNVNIEKTTIVSAVIDNISNKVVPSPGGIKLENLKGKFLGGDITGSVDIDTTKTPSGIEVGLKLLNASINSAATIIKLNQSDLNFSGTLPNGSLPEGQSKLELKNIVLENKEVSTKLNASINARTVAETLYLDQGFIKDINNKTINFSGQMTNSLNENRTLELKFPEVPIAEALGMLSPLVPPDFRGFKTSGYAEMDLIFHNLFYPQSRWGGKVSIRDSSFAGEYGGALLTVDDIDGTITIKDKVSSDNPLTAYMGEHLKLSKSIFKKFLKSFNESKLQEEELDFLSIKKIEYGILKFENVECALEVDRQKINLRRLLSKLYRGSFYGAGLIEFNQDQSTYNFSLLFDKISLESISERVSPGQEYITGRVNGLAWLSAEGVELDTVNGPFKFWSKRSSKEQRRIGGALLAKMGARERLILGSSRSYDNGNISGYINDGLITFREFEISNSILGIRNLTIQADAVRNSISISQLVSTVRELSRRSESGMPMIETN